MTMDEIPAIYEAESLEQVRALADELRVRIFSLLAQEPMTVTQVGKALDIAPAKIHYHVRELLERSGWCARSSRARRAASWRSITGPSRRTSQFRARWSRAPHAMNGRGGERVRPERRLWLHPRAGAPRATPDEEFQPILSASPTRRSG